MKRFRPKSVNIVTMGCAKNLVDSEHLMAKFASAGWQIEFDSDVKKHELVIINTCGFINDAKQESIDMILEYTQARQNGEIGNLCIVGCLSERYKKELRNEIPEADYILGVNNTEEIAGIFELDKIQYPEDERFLSTPSHYAYLKISEGCNRSCSFCIIPKIRGRFRSRPVERLVSEAKNLADKGVKELILVAQDLTSYGTDLYGENMLVPLLKKIEIISGINWIRLHYAFPSGFPLNLLDFMNESRKVCKYLDMPVQHISDNMLRIMRRGITREKTTGLIETIRKKVPGIALRTTLLTGHPGESEADFNELKEFVKNTRFERLGVFPYSHEENTYSYDNYRDDISEEEKARRASEIMKIQQDISREMNYGKVGKQIKVLVDREDDSFYYGRSEHDSPEVDNEILIKRTGKLIPGNFYTINVTGAGEFDLFAEVRKD